MKPGNNSFNTLSSLDVDGQEYYYFSLARLAEQNLSAIHRYPVHSRFCWKIFCVSNAEVTMPPGISRPLPSG